MAIDHDDRSKAEADPEMHRILDAMLEENETITARAVARKHLTIRHASSITRHDGRRALLERYKTMQNERRAWLGRIPKKSKSNVAADLAKKDARIAELERQVEILRASHVAMLLAVGELGGTIKWIRFFEDFREVREELKVMGLLPEAEVTSMRPYNRQHAR